MGGGLLQLVAYGAQDAYISGNPQITFWKGLYKRHTNFAMEPFRVNMSGEPIWGTRQSAVVNRYADLMFSTYIEVELPTLTTAGGTTGAQWNHGYFDGDGRLLGYNLVDRVEVDIGGQVIDRLYSEYMAVWSRLTFSDSKYNNLSSMLRTARYNANTLRFDANPGCRDGNGRQSIPNILYIPLPFFYTQNPGTALPLIALQYHEVKINVYWKSPQEVAGNFNTGLQTLPNATSAALYVDYVYLDTDERRRFAQQSHEYLIEQVQFNEDVGLSASSKRIDLTFNHPVKELIWVVQPSDYTDCKVPPSNYRSGVGQQSKRLTPFVYDGTPVFQQTIQINGQDRLDRRYGDYFNKVQPFQHHTGNPLGTGVYCYSFAVRPEEHQPSGTCNFSRIDTATLVLTMDGSEGINESDDTTWNVRIYAINYNVLRVMSGMGGLAFSN